MPNPRTDYVIATAVDLQEGLARVAGALSVRYVRNGLFPSPASEEYSDYRTIPDLSGNVAVETSKQNYYLILRSEIKTVAHRIPQRRGGVLYGIDVDSNPTAMVVSFGGIYDTDWLVVSQLMSSYDSRSHELFREFRRLLLKGFGRMKKYYVGPDAQARLQGGMRFCHSVGQEVWL